MSVNIQGIFPGKEKHEVCPELNRVVQYTFPYISKVYVSGQRTTCTCYT